MMDFLEHLFEEHYQFPAVHVQPLQGNLGGSGRVLIRLIQWEFPRLS